MDIEKGRDSWTRESNADPWLSSYDLQMGKSWGLNLLEIRKEIIKGK